MQPNNKSRWFSYAHLPEKLQASSKIFAEAAAQMVLLYPTGSDQLTLALQSLLDAKDRFVRACIINEEAKSAGSNGVI